LSFLRAFVYFLREALTSIRRSWKVSLLAVLTIAVSLFLGGLFLLLSGNLARIVGEWREAAKVVLYMQPESEGPEGGLDRDLLVVDWVTGVEEVSSDEASRRFDETFPALGQLLAGWEQEPLPRSLEISLDLDAVESSRFRTWLDELRRQPDVQMVDDDRQWLSQLETLVAVLRGLGVLIGGILLSAAVFTIGSVIKLTAYLYRDEIAVMRIVGATEFFIRGPFVLEGLVQGLLGGLLALGGLSLTFFFVVSKGLPTVLGSALLGSFLPASYQLSIVLLGAAAGLLGAALSLGRERPGTA